MSSFLKFIPLEERIVLDAAAAATVAISPDYTPSVNSAGFDPHLASAPVIYVNSSATGANDGSSWQNAYHSLQDALNAAASTPYADQIWMAKGTYAALSFNLPDAVAIYGGFDGTESSVLQRDPTLNQTVLVGNGLNAVGTRDVLSGLTFNGNVFLTGGALRINNGSQVVLANDVFTNNIALFQGGAVSVSNSMLDIENSTFLNNISRGVTPFAQGGGAILSTNSVLSIENSVFTNNRALSSVFVPSNTLAPNRGGAIDAVGNNTITIDQTSFTNNVAGGGNAINLESFISASMTIKDSIFNNNHTSSSNYNQFVSGGAIRVAGSTPFASSLVLEIQESEFSNNNIVTDPFAFFNGNGGAIDIENLSNGQIDLTSNVFDQNATVLPFSSPLGGQNAGGGGAIATRNVIHGDMTFTGNSFTANQAFLFGGAILNSIDPNFQGLSDVHYTYDTNVFDGNKSGTLSFSTGLGDAIIHFFVGGTTTFDSNTFSDHVNAPDVRLMNGNFTGTVEFQGNLFAGNLKGGIIAGSYASFTSYNDTFISNQSDFGGALEAGATFIKISKDTFIGNAARVGGALDVMGPNVTIEKSLFQNNTALLQAGAVSTGGGNVSIIGNSFVNNSAGILGSALADNSSGNVTISGNRFSDLGSQAEILLGGNQASINGDLNQADWTTLLVKANKDLTSDEIYIF